WIEIYNTTNDAIDLSGWFVQDDDGRTAPFPQGTTLQAGEVAVVLSADVRSPAEFSDNAAPRNSFYSAYPGDYQIILTNGFYGNDFEFGMATLSNGPSELNEILRLVQADGKVSDIANYDIEDNDPLNDPWPALSNTEPDFDGSSIFLSPGSYNEFDNDFGLNWQQSSIPNPAVFGTTTDGDTTRANDFTLDATAPNVNPATLDPAIVNPVHNGFYFWASPGTLQGVVTIASLGASPVFDTGACCMGDACVEGTEEDACDYALGTFFSATTCDANPCIPDCQGDANGDGNVNVDDFIDVLLNFGTAGPVGDANLDGAVNVDDFIAVLLNFGTCTPRI
ncbi:MAG: lamin tail domain-containing protein, partial [Planctomycetota bacterium]